MASLWRLKLAHWHPLGAFPCVFDVRLQETSSVFHVANGKKGTTRNLSAAFHCSVSPVQLAQAQDALLPWHEIYFVLLRRNICFEYIDVCVFNSIPLGVVCQSRKWEEKWMFWVSVIYWCELLLPPNIKSVYPSAHASVCLPVCLLGARDASQRY